MAKNCDEFGGSWQTADNRPGEGRWEGARTSPRNAAALVKDAYQEVLCREADSPGLDAWTRADLPLEALTAAISSSPEGQRVGNVRSVYISLLRRDPITSDCPGLRSWVESPASIDGIRAAVQASGEYARLNEM